MTASIRPYDNADRAAMTEFYRAAWHATYDAIDGADAIDRVIAALLVGEPPEMFDLASTDVALVAECDSELVGGLRGHPRDGVVHLSGMYVAAVSQRSGIGSALLAEMLRRFPVDTVMQADVRPSSASALRFYERHRFIVVGAGSGNVGGGHTVEMITMQRQSK